VGNTLEAVVGASLLSLVPGFRPSLERVADVVAIAVLAAGLSTAVSASVGVASLTLGGVIAPGAFWATWRVWWVGDALGALVVGSTILIWARPGEFRASTRARLGGLMGVDVEQGQRGIAPVILAECVVRGNGGRRMHQLGFGQPNDLRLAGGPRAGEHEGCTAGRRRRWVAAATEQELQPAPAG
jgi:hypothetical protein